MKIEIARPPNYFEIIRWLPQVARCRGVIFCYGDTIYNPEAIIVGPDLVAHETAHSVRQQEVGGPDLWWDLYLRDKGFRFNEEVKGYRAQYRYEVQHGVRQARRRALKDLSWRLAHPIYGGLVTEKQARDLLQELAA